MELDARLLVREYHSDILEEDSGGVDADILWVVIAGPPAALLTKSLALDFERRGFVVYMVVNSAEDKRVVRMNSRVEIRPLHLDIANVCLPRFLVCQFQ